MRPAISLIGIQAGQPAVLADNGLIGHSLGACLEQRIRQRTVSGKVEICIKNLILFEELVLRLDRLFDLDNHFRIVPYACSVGKDRGASVDIFAVLKARADARRCLNNDLIASINICFYIVRGQTHAELIVFDLFNQSDNHLKDLLE